MAKQRDDFSPAAVAEPVKPEPKPAAASPPSVNAPAVKSWIQFGDELAKAIEADGYFAKRRGGRLLKILRGPASQTKTDALKLMESHAKAQLGLTGDVDWSKVDWLSVMLIVAKLLLGLLLAGSIKA